MQFYFLAWEEASSTHTQGGSPFLIQWLHISMPFSAIFFPTAGAAFIFFCCEVEYLLHGEGGCMASFQEGAQPKLNWHKTHMFKGQNIWNCLANLGISLVVSLKVLRRILIPEWLFYRTNLIKSFLSKCSPLWSAAHKRRVGEFVWQVLCLYFIVFEVELCKIHFARWKNTLKHMENIGKTQYYQ